MAFPQTRPTLIARLAAAGNDVDWNDFLSDYWGPVCRFASRSANCPWHDAEDVASQTFLAIVEQKLLVRWASARAAKLRTLLCAVVRYVLANRARVHTGRARILREHGAEIGRREDAAEDAGAAEVFYAAWADDLLEQAVDLVTSDCQRDGQGDQVRVLYGKICEELTMAQIAASLGMTVSQAEQAFKNARRRLTQRLESLVRTHVGRYSTDEELDGDFALEWAELAAYLKGRGGLDDALRRAMEQISDRKPSSPALKATLVRLRQEERPSQSGD